jgi:ribosomal protein L6P/L9E
MWLGQIINNPNKIFFFLNETSIVIFKNCTTKKVALLKKNYLLLFCFNPILKFKVNKNFVTVVGSLFSFNYSNAYLTFYKKIIQAFYIFYIKKIKFDGKGYYLYRNKRNTLGLQFNYSHQLNVYNSSFALINFSKRSWMFFGANKSKLYNKISFLKQFRPINVFKLRGIRFSPQIILSKKRQT